MTRVVKNKAYYINSAICVLIMLCGWFLPTIGGITPYGMIVLGIFLGAIYGWVTVGFIWPSFLSMILLGLTDYGTIEAVFAEGFSNSVPLQIMISFIFFEVITKSGFVDYVSKWLVNLKINDGHPWIFSFILFFSSGLLSSVTNQFMVIVVFWVLIYSICNQLEYTIRDKWTNYVLVGVTCFAELTLTLFPFCPFSLIALGTASQVTDLGETNMLAWTMIGLLILLTTCLLYIIVGRYVLKIDVTKLKENIREINIEENILTKEAKIGAIYLAIFILIIVLPTILPDSWSITVFLNKFGLLGACSVCFIGLFFFMDENGNSKRNFSQFAKDGIAWEMLILVVATMPICAAMESDETGIITTFVSALTPIFQSTGPIAFVLLSVGILSIVSQFSHNLILMFVFLPPLTGICVELGINPILYVFLFMLGIDTAMATPGGSAASAMMFGNTKWIDRKRAYIYASLWVFICLVVLFVIGYPLGLIVF